MTRAVGKRGFCTGWAFVDTNDDWGAAGAGAIVWEQEVDHNPGSIGSARIGYGLDKVMSGVSLRPELETGDLSSGGSELTHTFTMAGATGTVLLDRDGNTSVFFCLDNLLADIEIIDCVELIMGGGVFGNVDFDDHTVLGSVSMASSATGFGYNVGAGLGFEVDLASSAPYAAGADSDSRSATVGV